LQLQPLRKTCFAAFAKLTEFCKRLPGITVIALSFSACLSTPDADYNNYVPKKPDAESNYAPEPMTDKTAFGYFRDEGIVVGWNIGNTLDAWGKSNEGMLSGENVNWGNPRINQAVFDGVKAAGFDIVRIPITWMGFIGPPNDYRISENYLKRVAEVAGYAHNAGLKVIINLHHDGASDGSNDSGWLSINTARRDQAGYDKVTFEFARVWKQIALYFKNHGDWLIFESFNELHDGGWGWSAEFRADPKSQIDITNKWNQVFTDVVRQTGGNNAGRFLVIPAYNTMQSVLISDLFKLPQDSAPDKQVVSFHYYDPYEFGILGDQKGGRSEWGTEAEKQKVIADFVPVKEKFVDNNIPVIIGETGAVLQLYSGDKEKENNARLARLEYLSYVYGKAKQYGLVPIYWDNGSTRGGGEKFGLFSRTTGQPNSEESAAVIRAMINAVRD
jgi:endoglucanase